MFSLFTFVAEIAAFTDDRQFENALAQQPQVLLCRLTRNSQTGYVFLSLESEQNEIQFNVAISRLEF